MRAVLFSLAVLAAACGGKGEANPQVPDPPPDYALVYDDTTVSEYEIEMTQTDWTALVAAPETYVPATLKFGAETYPNVGVRFKGNSSLNQEIQRLRGGDPNVKLSFKIHMNEYDDTLRFHGLKKLVFNGGFKDPSLIREKLAYELLAAAGAPTPRTSHIRLYVNVPGVYSREYFGVYTNTEQLNKQFLQYRYGNDSGNLFKAETGADCTYRGSDPNNYTTSYELKTNEDTPDYSALINFFDVLNYTPIPNLKAALDPIFNADGFLSVLAANVLLSSLDSYTGMAHNYFLYHNPATGKFEFIPWDTNEAFGQFKSGWTNAELISLNVYAPYGKTVPPPSRPLVYRLLQVPEYKAAYEDKLRALIAVGGPFTNAAMDPRMDELKALIDTDAHADYHKDYINADFDASLTTDVHPRPSAPVAPDFWCMGLKPFVTNRAAAVAGQLP